jgi:tetratricopeptide (TPR) repeat protein
MSLVLRLRRVFAKLREALLRDRALRQYESLQRLADDEIFDDPARSPIARALIALDNGDERAAQELLVDAYSRFPSRVGQSQDALRSALTVNLVDIAEALSQDGIKRSPGDVMYYEIYAEAGERRGDWQESLRRWRSVRKRFPDRPLSYLREAKCLGHTAKHEDVESFFSKSILVKFPDNYHVWAEYARLAGSRGDWMAALVRWQHLESLFPDSVDASLGLARVLPMLGRDEEAEARLLAVRYRRPTDASIAIDLAHYAVKRGNQEEVLKAWELVRLRWPERIEGYEGGAAAMIAIGRSEEAEALLASLPAKSPS